MELDGQGTKAKMETGYRPVFIGGRLAGNHPDNLANILIKRNANMITQEEVRRLFHYDPDTGVLTWRGPPNNRIKAGAEAGCIKTDLSGKKYRYVTVNRKGYRVHRLIWLYVRGYFPEEVDHQDGNGIHNEWLNLRETDRKGNSRNLRKCSVNKSGHTGVDWHKLHKKWHAGIRVNSVRKHLGYFDDINEAIKARKQAEIEHGFHANHGQERLL